ncbi:MAG TPA: 2-hydroxyacyl-CoA dehydratase family protein [Steroidobacteraceae bacterium]|jgi:benzoyl-CoA reductase/2-hydroxyglutaryl-CoA dehydratase subunit BcrC/BadD/HgdB
MSALAQLLAEADADPLQHARQHAQSGRRVIGVVGAEVPVELILAASATAVVLSGFGDEQAPRADRYLEPSFAPHLRSITEQWLRGRFDFMDAVIFTRADDSAQRCYYYLCELQRRGLALGPAPLIFDIAKIPRAASLVHSEAAISAIAAALGSDNSRLQAAIDARDRRRALFTRLDLLRRSDRPPPGADCEQLLRLADTVSAERFDGELAGWLGGEFREHRGPRLLLCGTSPPDGRLHQAVERAGGCIVAEIDDAGSDRLGARVGATSDPIAALAHHYHSLCHGPRGFCDRASRLVRRAIDWRVHGVISWLIEEDESSAWQVPAATAALAAARIPLLSLTRRRWNAQDGALEDIAAFTQGLKSP